MNLITTIEAEDIQTRIKIAYRHESGHAVIAAENGLLIRAEGIMVGQDGRGLSCYCKHPTGTDKSVEAAVLASFAGCYSENFFRRLHGYAERNYEMLMGSLDWAEARKLEGLFTDEYRNSRTINAVHAELEARAQKDVAAKWTAIEGLAQVLMSREWEPKKPLQSGGWWSDADMAKYVVGDEIVAVLAMYGIVAKSTKIC
jgi:hypothetical protein